MADKTTFYDPNGNIKIGYVINGQTYKDEGGTQRVDIGTTVPTTDGFYTLTETGGVKNPDFKEPVGGGTSNTPPTANGGSGAGGAYAPAQLPSASSGEQYINIWQDAAIAAAQQGLKTAYDENMLTLNAAGEKIPAQYQTARNQTAAQSELQRANFNQYAADTGLNSGAGGQAQLAIGNQLQGDLSGLTQAEANAKADLELQRTQLATKYQNDIAQAMKDGKLQEAQALYDNYWRMDAKLTEQKRYDDSVAHEKASTLAVYGDFSGYKALGYSDEQIAEMEADWKLQNTTQYVSTGGTRRSFGTDVMATPSWAKATPGGMIDPAILEALKNKDGITQAVTTMATEGKSPSYISSYLLHLITAGAITQGDYHKIMSSLSW